MKSGTAGPESDDVVPVKVTSLAAKAAAEQHNRPNALPRPLAWEPQVEARADDEQEERVRPTGDGAGKRPTFALNREPAVPGADFAHEGAHALIPFTEDAPCVSVGVDRLPARSNGDGGVGP